MKVPVNSSAFVMVQYPGEKNERRYRLNNVLFDTEDEKITSLIDVFLPFISQDCSIRSVILQQSHEYMK